MPLISPIGSGLGRRNEHNLEIIRNICKGLVFVWMLELGVLSDASRVMELGFDGVLLNSSVARSYDPINMAKAMKNVGKKWAIKFFIRCNREDKTCRKKHHI